MLQKKMGFYKMVMALTCVSSVMLMFIGTPLSMSAAIMLFLAARQICSNRYNIYAAGSQHVDCIHTQNINIPNLTTDSPSKGKEGMTADYSDEQTTQAIDLKQSREAVAAVVEKARASGATRDKNWWFCIYAPMAELNNNENSKSCFWDSDERGEYKAFFVLMHQWLEEDTKDFIDEAWTKSFSSEKKTWKRVGMLDRCERNRTLTPHECWADYALKKRLKQWNEKLCKRNCMR